MKGSKISVVLLLISLMFSTVSAETSDISACERTERLEKEVEKKLSAAETEQERQEIEQKYSSELEQAHEKCRLRQSNLSEPEKESISEIPEERKKPRETLGAEKCQRKAAEIKKNFIERFSEASFTKTGSVIASFRKKQERLIGRCPSFEEGEIPEGPSGRDLTEVEEDREEKRVELDYSLPEKMPEECRSRIKQMQKEYRQKIRNSKGKERKLRQKFYSKVEQKVERCGSVPRVANVSNAPDQMTESCRNRVRKLNRKIISQTDASIGSRVPEKFRDEYRKAMKSCVAGAAKKSITSRIKQKVLGGGKKKLKKKLEKKNRRIEKLEQKVERLQKRLESQKRQISGKNDQREQPEGESSVTGSREKNTEEETRADSRTGNSPPENQGEKQELESRENQQGNQKKGILESITGVFG